MIFGFISQYFNGRVVSRQMYKLFSQMKKNQEYSDLLARIMLETGENIRNTFMMNNVELIIADMNELLCEFVQKENLATKEQASQLWVKLQNGGKWAFGKVVVEAYNQNSQFKIKVLEDAKSDNILAGTIMEFCARYQALVSLLEKYDKEKTFLNVVETGVFGKVFSVLASVSDDLRRSREIPVVNKKQEYQFEAQDKDVLQTTSSDYITKFPSYKKELPKIRADKNDEFSMALERSFSSNSESQEISEEKEINHKEPAFTNNRSSYNEADTEEIPSSQKALDELKKGWLEIETKQDKSEDALAYPFGGWTDADKYQK
jgi:hypothetical protein